MSLYFLFFYLFFILQLILFWFWKFNQFFNLLLKFVDNFFKTLLVCFLLLRFVYIKKTVAGVICHNSWFLGGKSWGFCFLGLVGEFRFYVNKDVWYKKKKMKKKYGVVWLFGCINLWGMLLFSTEFALIIMFVCVPLCDYTIKYRFV